MVSLTIELSRAITGQYIVYVRSVLDGVTSGEYIANDICRVKNIIDQTADEWEKEENKK